MENGYMTVAALCEMQVRRLVAEDWDRAHPHRPVAQGRVIPALRGARGWLVRQMAAIRSVGAFGAPSAPASR
jgi:hypothetical protein